MPKIAVLVRDFGQDKQTVIQALRNTIETGVGDIIHAVASGVPVIEKRIFDRRDPAFPTRLVALVGVLTRAQVDFSMYELLDNQVFSNSAIYYEPTVDALCAIIEERLRSHEEQHKRA